MKLAAEYAEEASVAVCAAAPPVANVRPDPGTRADEIYMGQVRQEYLAALPIAAAMVVADGPVMRLLCTNARFLSLSLDAPPEQAGALGRIANAVIEGAVRNCFADQEEVLEFDWYDVDEIGGGHFFVRLVRLPLRTDNRQRCLLTLVDRTAEITNERSLRNEMLRDSLTGLPNRIAFSQTLEAAIGSPENDGQFAVLVIDLCRFSRINESMGPAAADELIVNVARRMLSSLRAGDTLARIGGDEFAVLLRLIDGPGDALHAARRIQQALSTPFRLSELEIRIDCAIGCAMMSDRISGSENLVRNAQVALKRAKFSRRVEVYQPGEISAAWRRFSLETELRRAIENDQLGLAFQPLIDLQTGAVAGFEALARWTHAERGAISPLEFIPVAEESGLIVPLGRWALEAATRTLAAWDRQAGQTMPIGMAVNLSAIQLARDDIGAVVAGALERNAICGHRLTLELTESAIVGDPERSARALGSLKELSAKLAMDDFGTGYSSLASLQRLPIDELKIDRSFVTGMLGDRDSLAIVRAVLGLAEALGMGTVAEGIETSELADALAELGCFYGQGYHFARPLTSEDAFAYWAARNC
ncbi:MAG: diguanylate cyclase/phosphodiesterase [Sphingomonas bacterium]|nr:diguanylate cyclase/phosphodiesterase [Sphingomonas bacterium]